MNSSYRLEKAHAGMDYLTEMTGELLENTKECTSKEEVVKELYWFYEDAKQTRAELMYNLNDPAHKEEMIKLIKFFAENGFLTGKHVN